MSVTTTPSPIKLSRNNFYGGCDTLFIQGAVADKEPIIWLHPGPGNGYNWDSWEFFTGWHEPYHCWPILNGLIDAGHPIVAPWLGYNFGSPNTYVYPRGGSGMVGLGLFIESYFGNDAKLNIVGYSMGGLNALTYLRFNSGMINSLTLINPALGLEDIANTDPKWLGNETLRADLSQVYTGSRTSSVADINAATLYIDPSRNMDQYDAEDMRRTQIISAVDDSLAHHSIAVEFAQAVGIPDDQQHWMSFGNHGLYQQAPEWDDLFTLRHYAAMSALS